MISCDKESNLTLTDNTVTKTELVIVDKIDIESASLDQKFQYRDFHFSNLLEKLAVLDPELKLEMADNAKNTNSSVYIEKLLDCNLTSSSKNDGSESIEAFKDLEGETLYPIINLHYQGKGKFKDAIFLISSYDQDNQKDFVKAYSFADNDKLEVINDDYTEEMFDELTKSSKGDYISSVYSVSFSLCPPGSGIYKSAACGGGGTGGGGSTAVRQDGVFGYMVIKKKKESWIEKADVNYQTWAVESPVSGALYGPCGNGCDTSGTEIGKWSNSDVNNQSIKIVNKKFYDDGNNTARKGSAVAYVIYEYDNWPATLRQFNSYVNGANFKFRYRSYDGPITKI